jgi:hypothetical protein
MQQKKIMFKMILSFLFIFNEKNQYRPGTVVECLYKNLGEAFVCTLVHKTKSGWTVKWEDGDTQNTKGHPKSHITRIIDAPDLEKVMLKIYLLPQKNYFFYHGISIFLKLPNNPLPPLGKKFLVFTKGGRSNIRHTKTTVFWQKFQNIFFSNFFLKYYFVFP